MCLLPASTLACLSRLGSFNFAQIATFELTCYSMWMGLGPPVDTVIDHLGLVKVRSCVDCTEA
jgi:hypothetical protein